jgi:hypothetical protein
MILTNIREGDLDKVHIRGQDLEVTIIPVLGGKISSIRWSGRELLAQNPSKKLVPARYAAPYADFDASGFDECIPTIGPCNYPEYPWKGVELPDHGEVWSLPWEVWEEDGDLCLRTHGIRLPYVFEKKVRILQPGEMHIQYTLVNPTPLPIKYLWSSHPLIAPQPGMRIYLPEGIKVRVDWSKDGRLGDLLSEHDWPLTYDCQGNAVDLSLILSDKVRLVDKLYTTRLPQGWCALHDPSDGMFLAFVFSPEKIPYVGLSINMGGWPVDETGQAPGYYNLGLEPCNGYPDRLDIAISRGDCQVLPAHSTTQWEMLFKVGQTDDISQTISALTMR